MKTEKKQVAFFISVDDNRLHYSSIFRLQMKYENLVLFLPLLLFHCGFKQSTKLWRSQTSHWVPALGTLKAIFGRHAAPVNSIIPDSNVGKSLRVGINKWIQESQWFLDFFVVLLHTYIIAQLIAEK